MTLRLPDLGLFSLFFALLAIVWQVQSPTVALTILNMALISGIMALGVNMQWGYAGIFNVGIAGFSALGGLVVVLIAMPPVPEAWAAGGSRAFLGIAVAAFAVIAAILAWRVLPKGRVRGLAVALILIAGYLFAEILYAPATRAIASVNPAVTGYIGGLGLPVIL